MEAKVCKFCRSNLSEAISKFLVASDFDHDVCSLYLHIFGGVTTAASRPEGLIFDDHRENDGVLQYVFEA